MGKKLSFYTICLSILGSRMTLFLCSGNFLYDEKCYNALKNNGITPLSRQTKRYFFPVTNQNNMVEYSEKKTKAFLDS